MQAQTSSKNLDNLGERKVSGTKRLKNVTKMKQKVKSDHLTFDQRIS